MAERSWFQFQLPSILFQDLANVLNKVRRYYELNNLERYKFSGLKLISLIKLFRQPSDFFVVSVSRSSSEETIPSCLSSGLTFCVMSYLTPSCHDFCQSNCFSASLLFQTSREHLMKETIEARMSSETVRNDG